MTATTIRRGSVDQRRGVHGSRGALTSLAVNWLDAGPERAQRNRGNPQRRLAVLIVLLVLFAAVAHATWNAFVKAGEDKLVSLCLVIFTTSFPALAALPFLLLSSDTGAEELVPGKYGFAQNGRSRHKFVAKTDRYSKEVHR